MFGLDVGGLTWVRIRIFSSHDWTMAATSHEDRERDDCASPSLGGEGEWRSGSGFPSKLSSLQWEEAVPSLLQSVLSTLSGRDAKDGEDSIGWKM